MVTRRRPRRNPNAKAKPEMTKVMKEYLKKSEKATDVEETLNDDNESKVKKNSKPRKSTKPVVNITDVEFEENVSSESENVKENETSKDKAVEEKKEETSVKKNNNFFAKMKGLLWF